MDEYENQFDLTRHVTVIWKRKWLIVIPALGLAAAAAVLSLLLPPVWEVDAVMLPNRFFIQTTLGRFEEVIGADPKQIAGEINQESYNEPIAAELNLDIREFPELKAETIRDTNLIRISVRDKDVDAAKAVLQALFARIKGGLDKKTDVEIKAINTEIAFKENAIKANNLAIKDRDNEIAMKRLLISDKQNAIKTKDNEVRMRNNDIKLKELDARSKEIEKDRIKKVIEGNQNKLKISEDRVASILEEMRSVQGRIQGIDEQLKKALAERKSGGDAVGLLLYSNEVQQNLRYYNTLDEKLSTEKITQENLRLSIRDQAQELLQIDNQISQIQTVIDSIRAGIDNIQTEISLIRTEIQKIGNEITAVKNDVEKIRNASDGLQSEIALLGGKKARIDSAQLVKPPTRSLYPVSPNLIKNVLIAVFLGVIVSSILAFFLEFLETQRAGTRRKT